MGELVKKRSGLGRGLDSLLPGSTSTQPPESRRSLRRIPADAIIPNPNQPRRVFDEELLGELTRSIEELGVLQPLLVRPASEGRFELIAGERRLRAARLAGIDTVPVVEVETDERGSLERALVENIHRADLNPLEEAAAYRQLLDEGGLTQEALGKRLGRSRAAIANALRLLELPVGVQRLLIEGRISAGHGKALLALSGNPFQERLARRVADEAMSVRGTEDLVRRYEQMVASSVPGTRGPGERPPMVSEAQRVLADRLQTRVRVEMGKRKGKIVVDFASLDELERLVGTIVADSGEAVRTVTPS
jgi:ParB family chromosome partitioning protein